MKKNKANSLYIHIPFCESICDYCDFTKLQYFRNFAIDYLKALKDELDSYHISNLKTIYVGGGTPTALEDDLFLELLELQRIFHLLWDFLISNIPHRLFLMNSI